MGASGAGGVDLGGSGAGFNPAAMMAGMAVGGAVGQNIAGTMNNMMSGANVQPASGAVPPPIPVSIYHVAVNGEPAGQFDIAALTQMAATGQLTADTLVWKAGMVEWIEAGAVPELCDVLGQIPPAIPKG
ncbi:DUF4339 domain-containing protein [Ruminococcaceae bacterium OttesenSCG-928-L11]|nr:DUF4339 domain-containing protein [Ruminococcaceae bacterium OttesenSCG-928-L11]